MAKLTPEQITKVSAWVAEGATLSQIQERLSTQLEVSMTYMDVRFLVDDLNLALVEKEEPKQPEVPAAEEAPAEAAAEEAPAAEAEAVTEEAPAEAAAEEDPAAEATEEEKTEA